MGLQLAFGLIKVPLLKIMSLPRLMLTVLYVLFEISPNKKRIKKSSSKRMFYFRHSLMPYQLVYLPKMTTAI